MPSCIVVPTTAYHDFVSGNGYRHFAAQRAEESRTASPQRLVQIEQEVRDTFARAALPQQVKEEIDSWSRKCTGGRFAVRSSATNEDLPNASFAGQYDSFLNVGAARVPYEIIRCFASLFNARATLYRRLKRLPEIGAMAVIVQEMLHSNFAGVVFTKAPRRPDSLLIECAVAPCEDIVSGNTTPNRYYVNRSTLIVEDFSEHQLIDFGGVKSAAETALAIEAEMGVAQDIEFGIARKTVYILQSRPVTV